MSRSDRFSHGIVRAAGGAGALGAGLVGVGEALHLWRAVGLGLGEGLGTLLYAAGLHGLFGFGGGLALGLVAQAFFRLGALAGLITLRRVGAAACALALFSGGIVVGTFRLQRDTALEGGSALGVALVVSLVLAFLVALFASWLIDRAGGYLGEGLLATSVLALIAGRLVLVPGMDPAMPSSSGSEERPNVIMVVVDTLRIDATGPYGAAHTGGVSPTPNLDRFAAEGLVFERMYANSTWTRPSMASLFTSRIPSGHGAVKQEDPLHHDLPHLAKAFSEAGYATAAVVTNVNLAPDFGFDMGFDAYRYFGPTRPLGATGPAVRLSLINVVRLLQERLTSRLAPERFYGEAPVITRDALELVDGLEAGGPFFLWAHYMDPHDPYFRRPYDGYGIARVRTPNPPAEWAHEMRELYDADVGYWDEHFGRLLDGLDERGLLDSSVVLVTSDHGEEFFEHGGWWHGETCHDVVSRVPLIVRLPGGAGGGHRDRRLAQIIDVAPTLLSSARLPVPEGMSGRDLLGADDDGADRVVVMEEDHGGMVLSGVVWDRYKLIRAEPDNPRGFPEFQLFDLERDPGEETNIADTEPRLVEQLIELLERRLAGEPAAPPASERRTVDVDAALEEDLRSLGYIQ